MFPEYSVTYVPGCSPYREIYVRTVAYRHAKGWLARLIVAAGSGQRAAGSGQRAAGSGNMTSVPSDALELLYQKRTEPSAAKRWRDLSGQ